MENYSIATPEDREHDNRAGTRPGTQRNVLVANRRPSLRIGANETVDASFVDSIRQASKAMSTNSRTIEQSDSSVAFLSVDRFPVVNLGPGNSGGNKCDRRSCSPGGAIKDENTQEIAINSVDASIRKKAETTRKVSTIGTSTSTQKKSFGKKKSPATTEKPSTFAALTSPFKLSNFSFFAEAMHNTQLQDGPDETEDLASTQHDNLTPLYLFHFY